MKTLSKLLTVILVLCLLAVPVFAGFRTMNATLTYRDIKILLNGQEVSATDVNGESTEPFIINGTTYVPVRAIAEALNCDVAWDDATSTIFLSTSGVLKAGAGEGTVIFPEAMFPMPEGFTTIHDNPHARVLVVENGQKIAIVSMELVNTPEDCIDIIKQVINEKTGTPLENIMVQSTHAFCTPHAPDDADQRAMFNEAVTVAITEAAEEAAASFRPAVYGIGIGESELTSNRDVPTADGGWTWGLNGEGDTDQSMTILKFDSLDGDTIGMIFAYGTRSYCADVSRGTSDREITTDLTGVAAAMLSEEFNAPALFLATADADQSPIEAAQDVQKDENGVAVQDKNGNVIATDLGVQEGLKIAARMGEKMGNDAIAIAKAISCSDAEAEVKCAPASFDWATLAGDGVMTVDMMAVTIGDTALVGIKPEANCITSLQLQEESPYNNTLFLSFVNGDQKYMPDAENYDLQKPESKKSGLAKGAAEECVRVAVELLENIQAGKICSDSGASDVGSSIITGETVEFGGYTWRVLAKEDGKSLVICENTVAAMAYRADGAATTWETSDVRAYLNSTFYNSFSAADQARILETTVSNKANSHYGTAAGKDTQDKFFLLSEKEAGQYFADNNDRIATDAEGNIMMWLLRTPGRDGEYVCDVNASGYVETHGILVVEADANEIHNEGGEIRDYASGVNGGIRPAMWLAD